MKKVAFTGMGLLSTAGHNLESFWDNLSNGRTMYGVMKEYEEDKNFRYNVGARIIDKPWQNEILKDFSDDYGLATNYTKYAVRQALADANLGNDDLQKYRTAMCISTTMGEIQEEETISVLKANGEEGKIGKTQYLKYKTENIGFKLQAELNISGPVYCIPAACAAGNYAVALGASLIENNTVDIVITVGVDVFSRVAFTGFQRLLSLTPDLCRPFDQNRKGLVVGEGCGVLILESQKVVKKRKARQRAFIAGTGLASDSYHMTSPHPQGKGAIQAMTKAIKNSDKDLNDIQYISAHGTGTRANDKIEVNAIKNIFAKEAIPPISSIKSMIGHSMGAASSLELIASILMMEKKILLPTINYSAEDPECNVDCVPNFCRTVQNLDCILSNSFAFGGQVSTILLSKN